jgi:hypothetical protein
MCPQRRCRGRSSSSPPDPSPLSLSFFLSLARTSGSRGVTQSSWSKMEKRGLDRLPAAPSPLACAGQCARVLAPSASQPRPFLGEGPVPQSRCGSFSSLCMRWAETWQPPTRRAPGVVPFSDECVSRTPSKNAMVSGEEHALRSSLTGRPLAAAAADPFSLFGITPTLLLFALPKVPAAFRPPPITTVSRGAPVFSCASPLTHHTLTHVDCTGQFIPRREKFVARACLCYPAQTSHVEVFFGLAFKSTGAGEDGRWAYGAGAVLLGRAAGIGCCRCPATEGRGWDGAGQGGASQGGQGVYAALVGLVCCAAELQPGRSLRAVVGCWCQKSHRGRTLSPAAGSAEAASGRTPFAPASLS